jgi:hypothetical protein
VCALKQKYLRVIFSPTKTVSGEVLFKGTSDTFRNDLYGQLLTVHHQQIRGCMPLSYTRDEMNLPLALLMCHVQQAHHK